MKSRNLLLIPLVALFFAALLPIGTISAAQTTMTASSWTGTVIEPGMTITIDVDISDATDLYGWEFKLAYRNDVLTATGASEGDFLSSGGTTFFKVQEINDEEGFIWVYCTLLAWPPPPGEPVSGDGTLATVTFEVLAGGVSGLDLPHTKLSDIKGRPIKHMAVGGYFGPPIEIEGTVQVSSRVFKLSHGTTFEFFGKVRNYAEPGTALVGVWARVVFEVITQEGVPLGSFRTDAAYIENDDKTPRLMASWEGLTIVDVGTYQLTAYSEFGWDGVNFPFQGEVTRTFSFTIRE